MPTYEYKNPAGETFEIVHSIKHLPPASIIVYPDKTWQDATKPIAGTYTDPETGETACSRIEYVQGLDADRRCYERQITGGGGIIVADYTPKPDKDGLPVSRAAPRRKGGKLRKVGGNMVREHDDGVFTNAKGQPIIDSNETARRVAKSTGMEID